MAKHKLIDVFPPEHEADIGQNMLQPKVRPIERENTWGDRLIIGGIIATAVTLLIYVVGFCVGWWGA